LATARARGASTAKLPTMSSAHAHDHVALLAGVKSNGEPVHELVPARQLADGTWEITGTPALAVGCAVGDHLTVDEDGSFHVVRRGGNLAIVALAPRGRDITEQGKTLQDDLRAVGGLVETHPDG